MPGRADDDTAARGRRSRRPRRSWARRKHLGRWTVLAALLVLVVGVLAVVLTWDSGRASFGERVDAAVASASAARPSTTAPTAVPTPSTASTAPSGTAQISTVKGRITAVGTDTFSIAGTNGIDYTIKVDAATTYQKNRSFASFALGNVITVKGTLDQGTVTAASVTLSSTR